MANVRAGSIKAQREALRRALAQCRELSHQVKQEIADASKEEMQTERKLEQSTQDFRVRLASLSSQPPVLTTAALQEALSAAQAQLAEDEKRLSFGFFERWRKCLDLKIRAGGAVEHKNAVGNPGREQGFANADAMAEACAEAKTIALKTSAFAEQRAEAQRWLLRFRSDLRAEEVETATLCQRLAEERRQSNEWWEWHMARLPEYHGDLEGLRQAEGFAKTMQLSKQASQARLRSQLQEQELAEERLALAREVVGKEEGEVEHMFVLLQEHEEQQQRLARQAVLEPHKVDRIQQVQHSTERLREACSLKSQLELASEEARKTEVDAKVARAELHTRCARASEELRDAERHLQFLREIRAREFSTLGDFEREKRQLLQVYRQEAVEHDRTKCRLQSPGNPGSTNAVPSQLPSDQRHVQSEDGFGHCGIGPSGRSRREDYLHSRVEVPLQQRSAQRRPL